MLVDRNDQVKIIDFGLAVPNTPAFRKPGNRTGTLQYMAPELLRREPTDERIDIFSFGATAFEFLTGKLPYDATEPMAMMRQRINSDPLDIAEANLSAPRAEACDLVRKLTPGARRTAGPKMSRSPRLSAASRCRPPRRRINRETGPTINLRMAIRSGWSPVRSGFSLAELVWKIRGRLKPTLTGGDKAFALFARAGPPNRRRSRLAEDAAPRMSEPHYSRAVTRARAGPSIAVTSASPDAPDSRSAASAATVPAVAPSGSRRSRNRTSPGAQLARATARRDAFFRKSDGPSASSRNRLTSPVEAPWSTR